MFLSVLKCGLGLSVDFCSMMSLLRPKRRDVELS